LKSNGWFVRKPLSQYLVMTLSHLNMFHLSRQHLEWNSVFSLHIRCIVPYDWMEEHNWQEIFQFHRNIPIENDMNRQRRFPGHIMILLHAFYYVAWFSTDHTYIYVFFDIMVHIFKLKFFFNHKLHSIFWPVSRIKCDAMRWCSS
jgi:hypothetical protein